MDTKKRQLEAIVGKNNVLDDRKTLEQFSKDESLSEPLQSVVRGAAGQGH